jgi:hypothetical protein
MVVGVDTHKDEHLALAVDHLDVYISQHRLPTTDMRYAGPQRWASRLGKVGALAQKMLWRYLFQFITQPATEHDNYLLCTLDGDCRRLSHNAIKLAPERWGKRARVLGSTLISADIHTLQIS